MKNAIRKTLELANSNRRMSAPAMVREDPETAAVISKMVAAPIPPTYDHQGQRAPTAPQTQAFKNVSQHTAQGIGDAETVMQLQPDMKLAREILTSCIVSPKDMVSTTLTYSGPKGLMAPEIMAALVARTKQHFEEDYKIEDVIRQSLEDMLFNTGSYAVAVIPENSIDDVINSPRKMSAESFKDHIDEGTGQIRNLNLLGPAVLTTPSVSRSRPGLSLESFHSTPVSAMDSRVTFEGIMDEAQEETFLYVTDNPNALKIPLINQKIREDRTLSILGINDNLLALEHAMTEAMEKNGMDRLSDRELSSLIYKDNHYGHQPITSLKTQEQLARRTVGAPLIVHLPSESVIPVFVPGTPNEQIGFFVLIDSDGNPVSRTANVDYYQELSARLNSNGSFPSAMLTKVRSMMGGFPSVQANQTDYSIRYWQEIVEADLLARLRNGHYSNGVQLASNQQVYRIMLARVLARKFTQLLFIPVELMTYFAFDYTPDGVGQSLLDDMKILNSLRSMLMFGNVMAAIKNSIGRTNVNIQLDPEDPDPKKTIEMAAHEIVRSRQQYFPLGMNSPTDLTDWLQRAGFDFTWENHPGIPALKIDFTEKHTDYTKVDEALMEDLNKKAIMSTGLSPENIDAAFHAEFATPMVQNNILLSKRIVKYQSAYEPQMWDHSRKEMMSNQPLRDDLRKILMDNFDALLPDKDDKRNAKNHEEAVSAQAEDARHKEFMSAATKAVTYQTSGGGVSNETPETPANGEAPPEEGTPYGATATKEVAAPKKTPAGAPVVDEAEDVTEKKKHFIVETMLVQYIRGFTIGLPRPNSITLENQMTAMKTYTDALDVALDAWISTEFFTQDLSGNISTEVDAIKKGVRSYYLRKWMAENGVMTELSELTTKAEDGKPALNVFDMQKTHMEGLVRSFTETMVKLTVVKNASNTLLDKTGAGGEGGGSSTPEAGAEGGGADFGLDTGGEEGGEGEEGAGGEGETPPGNETPAPAEGEEPEAGAPPAA